MSVKLLPIVKDWSCCQSAECCRIPKSIRMSMEEALAIVQATPFVPRVWRKASQDFVELQANPCPMLDGNRCMVYAIRPYSCRRFQCHRADGEAFDPSGPLGCRNLSDRLEQSREVRRAYARNQQKAQKWALKRGWSGREV